MNPSEMDSDSAPPPAYAQPRATENGGDSDMRDGDQASAGADGSVSSGARVAAAEVRNAQGPLPQPAEHLPAAELASTSATPRMRLVEADALYEDPVLRYWPDAQKEPAYTRLDVVGETHFEWRIASWSQLSANAERSEGRTRSEPFQFMGRTWRILLFPSGDKTPTPSVFIEADREEEPRDWALLINFGIEIRNVNNARHRWIQSGKHRFCPQQSDWGFKSTVTFSELTGMVAKKSATASPAPGSQSSLVAGAPFIEDDAVIIAAHLRCFRDPTGVTWWSWREVPYDSKANTGFVGLKNQGATCYMNSILQSLFLTPALRRAVFKVPTEQDADASRSVALALQRVFYNLMHADAAVDTRELTQSFGWDSVDSFLQHDVQEFCRVLLDAIENKMKGTEGEKVLADLFYGRVKSYIKCVNVEFESSREEDFSDVQLNVKNMSGLLEAFRDFTQEELMSGENQYQSDDHGLQDAKKGLIFTRLPKVLHLQLKRFEFDWQRETTVKINDRWEYPLEVDLAPFVLNSDGPQVYHLHGVLVHAGDVHGGHYYAFIRPSSDSDRWFRFDDDKVTPVLEEEVLEANFGVTLPSANSGDSGAEPPRKRLAGARFANAYMLIYISAADRAEILSPVYDVPAHLKQRLENERRAEEERERRRIEEANSCRMQIATEQRLAEQAHGVDMYNARAMHGQPQTEFPELQLPKDMLWRDAKQRIAQELGASPSTEELRFWSWQERINKTVRIEVPIGAEFDDERLDGMPLLNQIFSNRNSRLKMVFVERRPASAGRFPPVSQTDNNILIFIKRFDAEATSEEERLKIVGSVYATLDMRVGDLRPLVHALVGGDKSGERAEDYVLWEEVKPNRIDALDDLTADLGVAELMSGDILIYAPRAIPESARWRDPGSYYSWLHERTTVRFRPAVAEDAAARESAAEGSSERGGEFQLVLHLSDTYDAICEQVSKHIGHAADRIRLVVCHNGTPKTAVLRANGASLQDMISMGGYHGGGGSGPAGVMLAYERMERSIEDIETKMPLRAVIVDARGREVRTVERNVLKTEPISSFIDGAVEEYAREPVVEDGKVKKEGNAAPVPLVDLAERSVVLVENHKFTRELQELGQAVSTLPEGPGVAIVIAPKPTYDPSQVTLMHVCHFNKLTTQGHGLPFMYPVRLPIKIADLKRLLGLVLGLSEREMTRVRIAVVKNHRADYPDEESVLDEKLCDFSTYIGLDHPGRGVRSASNMERAIKIAS